MSSCCVCIRDVCVQIFTAGDVMKPGISRNGKIVSLVSFTFLFALIIAVLFGSTTIDTEVNGIIFRVLLIFLLLVASMIYIFFHCKRHKMSSGIQTNSIHMVHKIKIVFLFVFTGTCITFHAMKISIHIVCPEYSTIDNILRIFYDCEISLFHILQLTFIVRYSKRTIFQSCSTFFCATILVVTNASTFVFHSTKAYILETGHHEENADCLNQTITNDVFNRTKPFLDPTLLENALLGILLIYDIFSRCQINSADENQNTNDIIKNSCVFPCVVVISSLIMCAPYFVFKLIQLCDNDQEQSSAFTIMQPIYFIIFKVVNGLVVSKCFYYLHVNGQKHVKPLATHLNLSHYLILFSVFGTEIEFGVYCIASIAKKETLHILGNIANMFSTFIQTILILQMKDYEKIIEKTRFCDISNMFLYLSMTNLGLWIYTTFLEAQYVYKQLYPVEVYGYQTWQSVDHLLIPMVIFYRFKCFLSFLDLSTYSKKETYAPLSIHC